MNAASKILISAILLSLGASRSGIADIRRPDLLPENPFVVVRVSGVTNFCNRFKTSPWAKLWNDEQFREFLGNPSDDVWMELLDIDPEDPQDRVQMEELKMLKGEVILAAKKANADTKPYMLARMSFEDFSRSLEMDDRLNETLPEEDRIDISKEEFQGVEIIRHVRHRKPGGISSSWQAWANRTLVMGPSKEWVERCIVALKKDELEEPEEEPSISIELNLKTSIDQVIAEQRAKSTGNTNAPDPRTIFDALGLTGMGDLTLALSLSENASSIDLALEVDDLKKGVFSVIDPRPVELPTVTFVPSDPLAIEVGRIDFPKFFGTLPLILDAIKPGTGMQFSMLMSFFAQQTGVDVGEGLLNQMGTRYLSFSTSRNGKTLTLSALDLKDGATFDRNLQTLIAAPALAQQVNALIETNRFLDRVVYQTKTENPADSISFCVVDNYLFYGAPDALRQALRNLSSEESGNRDFEQSNLVRQLRKEVPDTAFGFGAVDWKRNMRTVVRELSKPRYADAIRQRWATSGSALPPPDMEKLPSAEHLASFFNLSFQYLEATDKGLHFHSTLKY